ncbi:PrgI family protein [Lachnospiraceae bacterium G41]|nr:PrgI family protein [Lachnospiraceae bacterium G41]
MELDENITGDLSKIKAKIVFGLTLRQIICFGAGLAVSLPFFFLTRKVIGLEMAAMLVMIIASPFFILGIYEKNGLYVEWILFFFIKRVKLRSQIRKRKIITNKEKEERKEFVRKEIKELEDKEKNSLRSGEKSKAFT